jgi:nitroreductase
MDAYLTIASKRDWRRYADREISDGVTLRILDAGRLSGSAVNRQPWTFLVVESDEMRERLADVVYAPDNIRGAKLVIVLTTTRAGAFDLGRVAQNMMLAAWNEGIVSCPNGFADADRAVEALGLTGDERPVNALSFGYPSRPRDPESRPAEEWSAEANRRPLDDVVQRI